MPSYSHLVLQDCSQNVICCLIKLITWDLIWSSANISKASIPSQAAFLISSWTHFRPSFLCDFNSFVHSPGDAGSLQPHSTHYLTGQKSKSGFRVQSVLGPVMRFLFRFWPGLHSSEGLTGAGIHLQSGALTAGCHARPQFLCDAAWVSSCYAAGFS